MQTIKHMPRTILMALAIAFFLSACSKPEQSSSHLGDAKLMVNSEGHELLALTSDGKLLLKSAFQSTTIYTGISANWVSTVLETDSSVIVAAASFDDHRMRIYRVNTLTHESKLLSVVGEGQLIDPALVKVKDKWLLALTRIVGKANAGKGEDPGEYSILLFQSEDLLHWKSTGTILQRQKNLEDGRLFYSENLARLFFFFEEEEYDKGPSSLKLIETSDLGLHWENETVLVSDGADNEPAGITEINDKLYFFYSSDKEHLGKSYGGAKAYFGIVNDSLSGQSSVLFEQPSPILLIDVVRYGEKIYAAAIKDYSTDPSLYVMFGSGWPNQSKMQMLPQN